jgi:hypothetical protein
MSDHPRSRPASADTDHDDEPSTPSPHASRPQQDTEADQESAAGAEGATTFTAPEGYEPL